MTSSERMVYRNPYHGYSDNEYGYNNNNTSGTHKSHQNGYSGHQNGGHHGSHGGHHGTNGGHYGGGGQDSEWTHANGYNTTQMGDVWRHDEGGGVTQGRAPVQASYRVMATPSPLSQTSISKPRQRTERWPGPLDFLASSWAFSLSLHSLWSLPVAVIRHGGLVFLLVYILLSLLLGGPLLVLEMFLGQYSGLAPLRLYSQLAPALAGVGVAVCLQALVRAALELGLMMWFGQILFRLFYSRDQVTPDTKLFYRDVLTMSEDTSLENVGGLNTQLVLVLGVAVLIILVLMVAGARSIGKVSMVCIPLCFMLMVTLVIRACLADGAPQGVLTFLSPDWRLLKEPSLWLEAAQHVVFSLQLGLGAQSALARCNKFRHNLVRDAAVVLVTHTVWVLLSVLLTLSLLGAAEETDPDLSVTSASLSHTQTGDNIWLAAVTILDKSLLTLSYGWLWAGLYFILVTITAITSLYGYVEVISSSLSDLRPRLVRFKPLMTFLVLCLIFLMDLSLATRAGLHIYHLVYSYIATWPTLLLALMTILGANLAHGTRYIMKDLSDVSKVSLPHLVTSHLSVIYTTVSPLLLTSAMAWALYTLHLDHLEDPLATFGVSLQELSWTQILGWSLFGLSVLPVVLGALLRLVWITRGVPVLTHLRQSFQPTDEWYSNEHAHIVKTSDRQSSTA